jgi:hypothetical protein
MIKIQLNRPGGMLGKSLQSSDQFELDEAKVVAQLQKNVATKDPLVRDGFHYSITINEGKSFVVDVNSLKGGLKKANEKLEEDLTSQ